MFEEQNQLPPGLPNRNHSPLARTASLLTSLFLSSRGRARARSTRARNGKTSCSGKRDRAWMHRRETILTSMAGLEWRASSLLIKASSCWMSAGGGSMRTGSRQDRVDSWTPWSGHDSASNSRDRSAGSSVTCTCLGSLLTILDRAFR